MSLSDDNLILLHERLLARRAALLDVAEAGADAGATVQLDQTSIGRLSRMDAMQGQAMSLETSRRRAQELKRIDGALRRIAAGDYGYCLTCEEAIAVNRLEVDPAATLCIACASAREQGGS